MIEERGNIHAQENRPILSILTALPCYCATHQKKHVAEC